MRTAVGARLCRGAVSVRRSRVQFISRAGPLPADTGARLKSRSVIVGDAAHGRSPRTSSKACAACDRVVAIGNDGALIAGAKVPQVVMVWCCERFPDQR